MGVKETPISDTADTADEDEEGEEGEDYSRCVAPAVLSSCHATAPPSSSRKAAARKSTVCRRMHPPKNASSSLSSESSWSACSSTDKIVGTDAARRLAQWDRSRHVTSMVAMQQPVWNALPAMFAMTFLASTRELKRREGHFNANELVNMTCAIVTVG